LVNQIAWSANSARRAWKELGSANNIYTRQIEEVNGSGAGRGRDLWGVGIDFVAGGSAVDGITGVLVDDFEGSRFCDVKIFESRFLDRTFLDDKSRSIGIFLPNGDWVSFFHHQSILGTIDGGIDSQGKDMLMVGGEDLIVDDGAVGNGLFVHGFVDWLGW
jgi:hypothetical protein